VREKHCSFAEKVWQKRSWYRPLKKECKQAGMPTPLDSHLFTHTGLAYTDQHLELERGETRWQVYMDIHYHYYVSVHTIYKYKEM
jgi:hypothetical protein